MPLLDTATSKFPESGNICSDKSTHFSDLPLYFMAFVIRLARASRVFMTSQDQVGKGAIRLNVIRVSYSRIFKVKIISSSMALKFTGVMAKSLRTTPEYHLSDSVSLLIR